MLLEFYYYYNGQIKSQYSITDLRQLNILTIDPEDGIIATYNLKAATGVLPEPALMSQ
jgi:hypothetical protein